MKLKEKAQRVFNAWIRNRDKNKPCISCGSWEDPQAGHYLSAGMHTAFRFNEMNVNRQCLRCNYFLSGNLIKYREGLVKLYGEEKVLWLESEKRKLKKWSEFELKEIIKMYQLKKVK